MRVGRDTSCFLAQRLCHYCPTTILCIVELRLMRATHVTPWGLAALLALAQAPFAIVAASANDESSIADASAVGSSTSEGLTLTGVGDMFFPSDPVDLAHGTDESPWKYEEDLLEFLEQNSEMSIPKYNVELLLTCIGRSWWTASRKLVERFHDRVASGGDVDPIMEEVSRKLARLKRQANSFAAFAEAKFRGQTDGLDEVHCAVQWSQNSSAVFIAVKYAARWSAPGAIEVVDVKTNVTARKFQLSGYGHHSSIRKHYTVDLDLLDNVLPDFSTWSAASVGRMTATLIKKKPRKWSRLTLKEGKLKHQVTTWLDMEERWASELKSFEKEMHNRVNGSGSTVKKSTRDKERKTGKKAKRPFRIAVMKWWKCLPEWFQFTFVSPERTALIFCAFLVSCCITFWQRGGSSSKRTVGTAESSQIGHSGATAEAAASAAEQRLNAVEVEGTPSMSHEENIAPTATTEFEPKTLDQ
eukprot:TRINITY_DN62770_c0_g1_i1.p1 TRINITY_DN62770_c0_g1~~TRINITY_DN62770_c0_g1_i1.p1  ORF type:complete len:471 (-),score=86.82 TRINITY_DN62770_c0_g1_i1:104-1516(-)